MITIFILICWCCQPAQASSFFEADRGPFRKLGRGLSNVAGSPFEIWQSVERENTRTGPIGAVTLGTVKGVFLMARRALVGVYETGTFLLPIPKDFHPIIDPEYPVSVE